MTLKNKAVVFDERAESLVGCYSCPNPAQLNQEKMEFLHHFANGECNGGSTFHPTVGYLLAAVMLRLYLSSSVLVIVEVV